MKLIVNKNDAINALDKNIRAAQECYQVRLGEWVETMKKHIVLLNQYLAEPDYEEEQPDGRVDKPCPVAPFRPIFPYELINLRKKLTNHAFDTVEITDYENNTIFNPYMRKKNVSRVTSGTISAEMLTADRITTI